VVAVASRNDTMTGMPSLRRARPADEAGVPTLEDLLGRVARGDNPAFAALYDRVANSVFGVIRRVLRDPAQSEEVAQEVLLEVWRTAARYDEERGSASAWIHTMAHRRAIDRVRAAQAAHDREEKVAVRDHEPEFDVVADRVEARLEQEQVRRCLDGLTDLQRESVTLAYYAGHTYREVAELLEVPLGTVKTRMRDGLIRLRDCLGVTA
jgi:RNA polymerase sigma-70 factor (ECF subfamily)